MINMNNRFLELLEKDCRLSPADLAVMLGKEEGDIRRLIEDYESAGVMVAVWLHDQYAFSLTVYGDCGIDLMIKLIDSVQRQ